MSIFFFGAIFAFIPLCFITAKTALSAVPPYGSIPPQRSGTGAATIACPKNRRLNFLRLYVI
jgi:hypothetical protein